MKRDPLMPGMAKGAARFERLDDAVCPPIDEVEDLPRGAAMGPGWEVGQLPMEKTAMEEVLWRAYVYPLISIPPGPSYFDYA